MATSINKSNHGCVTLADDFGETVNDPFLGVYFVSNYSEFDRAFKSLRITERADRQGWRCQVEGSTKFVRVHFVIQRVLPNAIDLVVLVLETAAPKISNRPGPVREGPTEVAHESVPNAPHFEDDDDHDDENEKIEALRIVRFSRVKGPDASLLSMMLMKDALS